MPLTTRTNFLKFSESARFVVCLVFCPSFPATTSLPILLFTINHLLRVYNILVVLRLLEIITLLNSCWLKTKSVLQTKVTDCYEAIAVLSSTSNSLKRKYDPVPSSPLGVMDAFFNSGSSNDSWVGTTGGLSGSSPPEEPQPLIKKSRVQEQQMRLPSLTRVFVDIVGSPR